MSRNSYTKKLFIGIAFLSHLFIHTAGYSQDNLIRDFGFNSNSSTTNGATYAIEVLNDATNKGKILVAGFFDRYNGIAVPGKIARLNPDGSIDNTFSAPALRGYWGDLGGGGFYSIAVQPWDGKVVVGGQFSIQAAGRTFTNIARLNTDGSIDITFNSSDGGTSGGGANGKVTKLLTLSPERQIVVSGVLGNYKGASIGNGRGGVFIINEAGDLVRDARVMTTSADWTGEGVTDMALTPDGKIVVVGEFGRVDTYLARRVAVLNRDGSFDATWANDGDRGVGPSGHVTSVAVQPDGKILIGGHFTFYNEYNKGTGVTTTVNRTRIARLTSNGKVDKTFNYDSTTNTWLTRGFNAEVRDILLGRDGNIYAAGLFTQYGVSTISTGRIARLLPDGAIDNNFNADNFNNGVYGIAFQHWRSDGTHKEEAHLLAVGEFTNYDDVGTQQYTTRFTIVPSTSEDNAGPPPPTPVVLANAISNFTAIRADESKNKLAWKALQAQATYIVERSFDGRTFQKIASYQNANANSYLTHYDIITNSSKVYYRIGVLFNGSTTAGQKSVEYSNMVALSMSAGISANLYLTQNSIKVFISSTTLPNESFTVQVLTSSGQQVLHKQLTMRNKILDETIWASQSLRNCLVVLTDSQGNVLKKLVLR